VDAARKPLSPRLAAVAREIAAGSRVADVGTDHGRLPVWLAENGTASYCLATERSEALLAPLARAKLGAPWSERVVGRAGDGLGAIRPEDRIDTVVLAGLGGRTIARLLSGEAGRGLAFTHLVLQPRGEAAAVRRGLSGNGWRLVSESLVEERGRLHLTLAAHRGGDDDLYRHDALDREDLLAAGPLLVRAPSPEFREAWRRERERLAIVLARPGAGASKARARADFARAGRVLAVISTRGG